METPMDDTEMDIDLNGDGESVRLRSLVGGRPMFLQRLATQSSVRWNVFFDPWP